MIYSVVENVILFNFLPNASAERGALLILIDIKVKLRILFSRDIVSDLNWMPRGTTITALVFFHKANSLKKKLALLQSFSDCWIKLLRFSPVKVPFPFHVLIYFICVPVCVRWNLAIANWQILLVSVNAL